MSSCGHCDCADGGEPTATSQTTKTDTASANENKGNNAVSATTAASAAAGARATARRGRGRGRVRVRGRGGAGRGASRRRRGARNRIPADILENSELQKAVAAVRIFGNWPGLDYLVRGFDVLTIIAQGTLCNALMHVMH